MLSQIYLHQFTSSTATSSPKHFRKSVLHLPSLFISTIVFMNNAKKSYLNIMPSFVGLSLNRSTILLGVNVRRLYKRFHSANIPCFSSSSSFYILGVIS
ncbi:hypothetical protein Hanom_Chr07g00609981 [Helianthus anomalus]